MNTIRFIPCLLLAMLTITAVGTGQNRDFQAQRLVIDDSAADGLFNTMTLQTPNSLLQNVLLTFPDPGSAGAQILLAPPGSDGAWLLNGNAGTTAGTNFIGTTDSVAFHVRTNNIDRLIFNLNGSIQRDSGGNIRGANAVDLQANRFAATQVASGNQSVVGGGFANTTSGLQSTVGGGVNNNASGLQSTVGGGINNTASEPYSTVGGGTNNTASGSTSTVGGGFNNNASGVEAVIGGGSGNTAPGIESTVGGGINNTASGLQSVVGGGINNTASGVYATVGGGSRNRVAGDHSAIPGGNGLTLDTAADGSFGFLGDNASGSKNMTISTPNVAVFGNTDMWLANNDSAASQLRFYEAYNSNGAFPNGTNYTSFEAGAQASDINYILPLSTTSTATLEEGLLQLDTATGQLSWLDPATVATTFAWSLTGNAGTTAGTNFIGTTDNVAFHVRTNNVDRMIFNLNGSIQRDTGGNGRGARAIELQTNRSAVTQVASGFGATISGGANNTASNQYTSVGGGISNSATDDYATVGGGIENVADGLYATVAGGRENRATNPGSAVGGGFSNVASGSQSVVSGGSSNVASGVYAVIGGGGNNRSSQFYSTVAGGIQNQATGRASVVAGGFANNANGDYSTVAGGRGLTIDGDGSFGFLANGGLDSMIVSEPNVAVFGNTDMWLANNDSGASQLRFYETYDTAGAFPNGTNYTSFEAGPQASDINYILPLSATPTTTVEEGLLQIDTATGQLSWVDPLTIATTFAWSLTGNAGTTAGTNFIGTTDNVALHVRTNNTDQMIFNTNGSVQRDTGGNGRGARAIELQTKRSAATQVASGDESVIGGGLNNTASGDRATIGGGFDNSATWPLSTVGGGGGNIASEFGTTVSGGFSNTGSGSFAAVGGGLANIVSGSYATVGGGGSNTVGGEMSVIPGGYGMTLNGSAKRSFGFLGGNAIGTNSMTISTPDVAVFGNTDMWLANNDSSASQLRFYEANPTTGAFPGSTNYTSFEAGAQTGDINYTLPTSVPAVDGEVMTSSTGGVMSWTSDPTLTSLRLNGATAVTNSRIVVNEGHWTTQGTAPTAAGDGTNLAAGVTVAPPSTDVAGIVTATDGGSVGTGVITVTFNAAYNSSPVVLVVPSNALAAGASFFVSNVTTTTFDINVSTTSGNGTDTYTFNYHVIEMD